MAGIPFQDIKYSDVAQQGQGEKDTYARKYGYPGWNEMEAAGGANLIGGYGTFSAGPSSSDILAKQAAEEEKLFGEYETIRAGQEKLPALYARLKTETPGYASAQTQLETARGEVARVKAILDRLEEDVNATTTQGQGFVSEAQRNRILTQAEAPLRKDLGRYLTGQEIAAGQVSAAQTEIGQQFSLATSQQEREMENIKMRIVAFSDRAAREMNAYTADKKNELDLYIEKLRVEGTLTQQEMVNASQLAQIERQSIADAKKIQIQMEANVKEAILKKGAGVGTTAGATVAAPTSPKPTTAPTSSSFGGFNYYSNLFNEF